MKTLLALLIALFAVPAMGQETIPPPNPSDQPREAYYYAGRVFVRLETVPRRVALDTRQIVSLSGTGVTYHSFLWSTTGNATINVDIESSTDCVNWDSVSADLTTESDSHTFEGGFCAVAITIDALSAGYVDISYTGTAGLPQAQVLTPNLNNIRMCDQFTGATASAKIAACIDDLPATGGTADARGLEGAQTWDSDPFTGETEPITLILGAATYTVSATSTAPSNVNIYAESGASLSVSNGITVTLNGGFDGTPTTHFSGNGSVVFSTTDSRTRVVYPQWWGAVGDASTASGPAFVSAVAAAGTGGVIEVPAGTYNVTFAGQTGDGLALRQGQTFIGYGAIFSNQAARTAAGFLRVVDATDVKIYGLEYDGNISVVTPDANNGVSAIIANRADRLLIKDVYIHDPGLDSLYIEDSQDVVIDGVRVANSPRFGMTFASTLENADGLALANSSFTGDGYGDSASGGCIDIESAGFLTRYANIANFTCKPHANVFSAGIVLHDNGHNLTNVTCIMPANVAKPCVNTQPDVSNIRISNSYFESSGDAIATLLLEGDDITISNTKVLNTGDATPNQTYTIRGDSSTGATDVQINGGRLEGYHGNIVENLRTTAIWQFNGVMVVAGTGNTVTVQLNGPLNSVNGGYFERARLNINGNGSSVTGATFDGISQTNDAINVSATVQAYSITNNIISRYANGIEVENGALYGYIGGNVVYNGDTDGIRINSSGNNWSLVGPNITFDSQGTPTQNRGVFVNGGGTPVMAQVSTNNVTAQVATETGMYSNFGFLPCSDSAGDAACGGNVSGSFVIDAGDTDSVVSTTSVGLNSQIFVFEDNSLGTRLGVTCNTTTGRTYTVTARTNVTSFTVTASAAPSTNPACMSFLVIN